MDCVFRTALFILLVLGFAPASYATLYYDYDAINTWMSQNNPVKTGTFDISGDFTPGQERVIAAAFVFTFIDTDNREDTVRIDLGDGDMVLRETVNYGFNIFGGRLNVDALIDLNEEGIIDYEIRFRYGDPFYLKDGLLVADARPVSSGTQPVPDGGSTIALLGLAMLGLGWARTRLAPSRSRQA